MSAEVLALCKRLATMKLGPETRSYFVAGRALIMTAEQLLVAGALSKREFRTFGAFVKRRALTEFRRSTKKRLAAAKKITRRKKR